MVALIRTGVPETGGTWADLGAGAGSCTGALRDLVGTSGTIFAVDRDAEAIHRLRQALAGEPGAAIRPVQGDFTAHLDLPPLDGLLMANALHFVGGQLATLRQVVSYLRPGGRFLLVEYDAPGGLPWIPFPLPFERFGALAAQAGLSTPTLVGARRSPSTGVVMYAAAALREHSGAPPDSLVL